MKHKDMPLEDSVTLSGTVTYDAVFKIATKVLILQSENLPCFKLNRNRIPKKVSLNSSEIFCVHFLVPVDFQVSQNLLNY